MRLYIYWSLNREMGGRNHLLCDHLLLLGSHATRGKMTSVADEEVLPTNQGIKKGRATSCLITHLTVSMKKIIFFFCLHGDSIALLLLILEGLCSQACVSGSATTGLGIHQCVTSLKHHLCWHYIMIYVLFRVLQQLEIPELAQLLENIQQYSKTLIRGSQTLTDQTTESSTQTYLNQISLKCCEVSKVNTPQAINEGLIQVERICLP